MITTEAIEILQRMMNDAYYGSHVHEALIMGIDALEKQKEQKPAEWSEEDTEMYINVACSLRGYACGLENEGHKKHIKKELDWFENRFKSLHPQPKQEWSEEDEFFRQQLIVYCENCVQDTLAAKCVDWLKSLRPQPHWKPSEEQMEALKYALGKGGTYNKEALDSLLTDLQKLL